MRTICLLIASALLAGPVAAQQNNKNPNQNPNNTNPNTTTQNTKNATPKLSSLMLLYNKDVQKELNLSDDQVNKVNEELTFQREARKNLKDVTDETQRNQKVEALNQRCEQTVNGILKNDQTRRLRQISYQAFGPQAFSRTEVVETLKITPEQRQKIKQIQETTYRQVQTNFEPGGNRDEAIKKRTDTVNRAFTQIMQVLTPEQKERWKEMTGAPFQGNFRTTAGRTAKISS